MINTNKIADDKKIEKVTPFLKWAGGKRWLVTSPHWKTPKTFRRYFEPFLGSGAAYFSILPKEATLNDANTDLINCYKMLRDYPDDVNRELRHHEGCHSDEYYYEVRAMKSTNKISDAARFIYLNRTCWNGLYRVNLRGEFNVPRGTKNQIILPTDNFLHVSNTLKGAELLTGDFESVIDRAQCGDFIFLDPPYTVKHNFNGFIKYNEKIFSWRDQVRLRDALARANQRGALFLMTNARHESILDLYEGFGSQQEVSRQSVLSGNPAYRSKVEELLIWNF